MRSPVATCDALRYTARHVMSQDQLIKLVCEKCKRTNYYSRKNKKLVTKKVELKKFCKWCKKQTKHKEAKK
jgi:large subunit ribosomal protein L33